MKLKTLKSMTKLSGTVTHALEEELILKDEATPFSLYSAAKFAKAGDQVTMISNAGGIVVIKNDTTNQSRILFGALPTMETLFPMDAVFFIAIFAFGLGTLWLSSNGQMPGNLPPGVIGLPGLIGSGIAYFLYTRSKAETAKKQIETHFAI